MKTVSTLVLVALTTSLTTAVILLALILPKYSGVDPLGWGAILGILSSQTAVESVKTKQIGQPALPSTSASVNQTIATSQDTNIEDDPLSVRVDTVELSIPARKTLDYRLAMERDYDLDYSWKAKSKSPLVSVLRGESDDGKIPSKTFAKLNSTAGSGFFIVPFNGKIGWHWVNNSDQPVTLRLTTKGHYKIVGEVAG